MHCPFTKELYSFPEMKKSKACLGAKNESIFKNYCIMNYDNCRVYKIRMENLEQEQRKELNTLRLDDLDNMEEYENGDDLF